MQAISQADVAEWVWSSKVKDLSAIRTYFKVLRGVAMLGPPLVDVHAASIQETTLTKLNCSHTGTGMHPSTSWQAILLGFLPPSVLLLSVGLRGPKYPKRLRRNHYREKTKQAA